MPQWLKRTPPNWMRHIAPWGLLVWLDHHLPVCWASVVTWKIGAGAMSDSWWPNRTCFYAEPYRYDYCGKFQPEQEAAVAEPDIMVRFL